MMIKKSLNLIYILQMQVSAESFEEEGDFREVIWTI